MDEVPDSNINGWTSDSKGTRPCALLYLLCCNVRRSCHLSATIFCPHLRSRQEVEEDHFTVSARSEGLSDPRECVGPPHERSDLGKLRVVGQ